MRTKFIWMLVLSVGVAGSMIGASGFEEAWGSPAPQTDVAEEQLNEHAEDLNPDDNSPVQGPVTSGDSAIVGIIVDSLSSIVSLAAAVAALPLTLINLGFPKWFAVPIGSLAYVISGIGVIQFATNRVLS